MMQRAYRRIYKSVGTEKRMVSRIQGSKIGNEKIQLAQEITRTFLNEEQQMPKRGLIER